MATPPRILLFGHCHGVHVVPMVTALKSRADFRFSVLEMVSPGAECRGANPTGVYEAVYAAPQSNGAHALQHWRQAASLLVASHPVGRARAAWRLVKPLFRGRSKGPRTKALGRALRELQEQKLFSRIQGQFDLFHLHFMDPSLAEVVRALPADAPLLVSIWGSDLLRVAGASAYARQWEICQRANLVTVFPLELKEVFLAKFGRELASKIRMPAFGSSGMGSLRSLDLPSAKAAFRRHCNIPDRKVVVCLGHNGARDNRHLEALRALAHLSAEVLDRIVIVLPMTYGATPEYVASVKQSAHDFGCEVRVLQDFLSGDDMLRLRAGSDIMIHVPVSDGMSGAMCETIYAGNVVITGAWLRYGELRRRRVHLHEVGSIQEVPEVLAAVVQNLDRERQAVSATKEAIREVKDWDCLVQGWLDVYQELFATN